jgi:hypothetical protein
LIAYFYNLLRLNRFLRRVWLFIIDFMAVIAVTVITLSILSALSAIVSRGVVSTASATIATSTARLLLDIGLLLLLTFIVALTLSSTATGSA